MFAKVWNHLGGCGEDAAVTEEAVVSGVAAFHGRTEVESPNDAAAVSDDNGRRRLKQKQNLCYARYCATREDLKFLHFREKNKQYHRLNAVSRLPPV
jgi:Mg-chelatase subunit ChlI